MTAYTKTLFVGLAAILATTPILAQQQPPRVSEQCRAEITKLCGTDRSKMRGCLRENYTKLSEGCLTEVRAMMQARQRQQPQGQ